MKSLTFLALFFGAWLLLYLFLLLSACRSIRYVPLCNDTVDTCSWTVHTTRVRDSSGVVCLESNSFNKAGNRIEWFRAGGTKISYVMLDTYNTRLKWYLYKATGYYSSNDTAYYVIFWGNKRQVDISSIHFYKYTEYLP